VAAANPRRGSATARRRRRVGAPNRHRSGTDVCAVRRYRRSRGCVGGLPHPGWQVTILCRNGLGACAYGWDASHRPRHIEELPAVAALFVGLAVLGQPLYVAVQSEIAPELLRHEPGESRTQATLDPARAGVRLAQWTKNRKRVKRSARGTPQLSGVFGSSSPTNARFAEAVRGTRGNTVQDRPFSAP
jgi:hypothetical protein